MSPQSLDYIFTRTGDCFLLQRLELDGLSNDGIVAIRRVIAYRLPSPTWDGGSKSAA